MRYELRILGPVILILLAGYFASFSSFPNFSSSSSLSLFTGAVVEDAANCAPENIVFRLSAATNAHAATYDNYPASYTTVVCAENVQETSRTCTSSNVIVKLSAATNAHVQQGDQQGYSESVCYGDLSCTYETGSCPANTQCLAALSASTNAHVAACGTTGYPISICCSEGGIGGGGVPATQDTDKDGVFDDGDGKGIGNNLCDPTKYTSFETCDDNCIINPNGPSLGTCVGGSYATEICDPTNTNANNICPNECQINQQDTDGDGAGDVCDSFPTNSCSILVAGDNCQNYNSCAESLTARWQQTSAAEGNSVTLEVTGDSSCKDLTFTFRVFDSQNPNLVERDPEPASFSNGKATSTWEAEYHSSGTNQYYFQANSQQNIQVSSSLNALLKVTASSSPAVCGDGVTQRSQGEQCDEGNNNCQWTKQQISSTKTCSSSKTCDADCQLIPGQQGQACRTDPQCQGKIPGLFAVCNSQQPTQLAFCIRGVGGCLQLSTSQQCPTVGGVQQICAPNAQSCISPTCTPRITTESCQGQSQQITCTPGSPSHCAQYCTNQGYPKTQPCFEEPAGEAFPFFSGFNILATILLLTTFYLVRGGVRRWK